jgi:hypothetical protein
MCIICIVLYVIIYTQIKNLYCNCRPVIINYAMDYNVAQLNKQKYSRFPTGNTSLFLPRAPPP